MMDRSPAVLVAPSRWSRRQFLTKGRELLPAEREDAASRRSKVSQGVALIAGLFCFLRDWSLIKGRGGGYKTGGGGAREVLPLRKGGAEKVLAMLKGGITSFGVVFTQ